MKTQPKGFSVIEAFIVLAVIILVVAGGSLIIKAQHKKSGPAPAGTSPSESRQANLKQYTNTEYGFVFSYPESWTLKTDLKDLGRGGNEGEVSVTAPSGTRVYFNPHKSGKDGSCMSDSSDRPDFTQNCATLRILSTEKTPGSTDEKPVYLTHRKVTESIERGSNALYFITLTTTDESLKVGTPFTENEGAVYQDVTLEDKGYVRVYITHASSATTAGYGIDEAYFETKEVEEGLPILKSFKLL